MTRCSLTGRVLPVALLRDVLEVGKGLGPEPLEFGPHPTEPINPCLVDVAAPLRPAPDEPGVGEDPKVLRHRWSAHWQLPGDFRNRARVVRDAGQNLAPNPAT